MQHTLPATTEPNFILLNVDDPVASARFYAGLIGKEPVEASPGFAMFALASGVMLGLWLKPDVIPAAGAAGGSELAFTAFGTAAVDQLCASWQRRGLRIAQPPTMMDFGYTFVALDPDGHRLRVFSPPAA
jgi:predicted lactoylglutathione lyase